MLQGHQGICVDSCQQRGVPDSPGGRGTDTTLGYLVAQGHRDTAEGMTHAFCTNVGWDLGSPEKQKDEEHTEEGGLPNSPSQALSALEERKQEGAWEDGGWRWELVSYR